MTTRRIPSSQRSAVREGAAKGGVPTPPTAGIPPAEVISRSEIRANIGRYIAMTMPPMTTPRKTIMTGSISAIMPSTAASTSSS